MMDLSRDVVVFRDGTLLVNVHTREQCQTVYCAIHNQSDHPLRDADLHWDGETASLWRRCAHGRLHPDPDDVRYLTVVRNEWFSVPLLNQHALSCDGCC